MRDRRGVSSVADVSLALVLVVASVGVFAAHLDTTGTDHRPETAAQTAETLGASTLNVTYSLRPVLETESEHVHAVDDGSSPYDAAALDRSTHGATMGHVARAALTNARFPSETGGVAPLAVGDTYETQLGERLLVSLVGAQFATNLTAVWEPFEGASIRGTASFGQPIPPSQRSVVRTNIASELPPAREDALAAVSGENTTDEAYEAVARVVADAVLRGAIGESQRELETVGVERAVVVSRYLRFADAVGGDEVDRSDLEGNLERTSADAEAMVSTLVDGFTTQLRAELEASFETPQAAASAVSTGKVTISVTTWTR